MQQMELDIPLHLRRSHTGNVAVTAMRAGAHDYVMKDNLASPVAVMTGNYKSIMCARSNSSGAAAFGFVESNYAHGG
ncbi:MAG: hypothetical protein R3E31_09450 [Chloroflexota bacterium]